MRSTLPHSEGPAALLQQKPAGLWHQGRKCKETLALHKPCGSFLAMDPRLPRACVWFLSLRPGPVQTGCLVWCFSPKRTSDRAEEERGAGLKGAVTQGNRSQGPAFGTCSWSVLPSVPATCPPAHSGSLLCVFEVMAPAVEPGLFFLSLFSFLSKGFIKILGRQSWVYHLESLGKFCHMAETYHHCLKHSTLWCHSLPVVIQGQKCR